MVSWSDHALTDIEKDSLDRKRLVSSLVGLLSGDGLQTPLVVGIYGDWGGGKTTVMRMLRAQLDPSPDAEAGENENVEAGNGHENKTLSLWFDAWKFARSEHSLWRALLLAVIDELEEKLPKDEKLKEQLNQLREQLFRSLTVKEKGNLQVNWGEALPFTVDVGIRLMTAGLGDKLGIGDWVKNLFGDEAEKISEDDAKEAAKLIERTYSEHYRAQITAIDEFERTLSKLIKSQLVDRGLRLTVFVDDLDRCLPEDAIAALEAIKLFFDIQGCAFVLGMDRDVVERGILSRFPPIETAAEGDKTKRVERVDPRKYLDKIVQIPMTLPPLTKKQVGDYLEDLFDRKDVETSLEQCRELIETAAPPNPRTLKRVLNVLALLLPIRGGDATESMRLAKVVLMQVVFDDAYELVRNDPPSIKDFERGADGQNVKEDIKKQLEALPPLKELMKLAPKFEGIEDSELVDLIAQTEVTANSRS